ncbi:RNA polymerase sigma factor SigK [Tsukamurella pulmonis]|uniref:RNA polymerase sigma factor n=1 Tax=Tsukamurella pulmonis TaxID=47312 RepID=A0A1H1C4T8_9ACTN|nr:ECF RNA polymerase sigma factor SigK [Tsukamurella pulmonis]KXO90062.1 RNA polymerase subunit sigma [Tsukamurella pulmonis]KXP11313.1 RNA polymerase subunit sigma [Tsukamurella pulmonis]RDH09313.1 RNA polymerase subunit sigma [Tsukamurella pulmonis]SDQ59124.1 RNA polymerase sigma-70 factor, ECF subfamily [Tsukamurella pulmonis]SUP24228.1 Sigma-K factor [Tsukamurella pulmonis]
MTRARSEADDLLVRTAAGDVGAFRDLYERTGRLVFGTALRVVGDRGYSEEITQEVYLEAWRKASGFDPARGSAEAWLVTVAHRRSVDRVRAERSRGDRENSFAYADFERPHDVVAEATERREDSGAVVECLDTLSGPQRDALTLAYYGGHTYREVSERVGAPLATVKSRIRDGIARLRRCLEPLGVPS